MAGDTVITVIGNLTADPELRFTPACVRDPREQPEPAPLVGELGRDRSLRTHQPSQWLLRNGHLRNIGTLAIHLG